MVVLISFVLILGCDIASAWYYALRYGLDGMPIPIRPGVYTVYLNGYDAGTEANDEVITGGGAPGVPGIPGDPGGNSGTVQDQSRCLVSD